MLRVERGQSWAERAEDAGEELVQGVDASEASLGILFASPHYQADRLIAAVQGGLGKVPVFGCTTAGEIGGRGFSSGSAVLMTLTSDRLRVGAGLQCGVSDSALRCGRDAAATAMSGVEKAAVAMAMVDGRTGHEEGFIAGVSTVTSGTPVLGGSASDDLASTPSARVFADGQAFADCGLVLALETEMPFSVLVSEHHDPTETRVVITDCDPWARLVHEINGRAAVEEFARIYGLALPLNNSTAGRYPFAQLVDGSPYLRSVMAVEGRSLRFACAVENGMVLRTTEPRGLVSSTAGALEGAETAVGGEIAAMIVFHCLGRYLEAEATGQVDELGALFAAHPVVGFNTFGEQVNALHVNHTVTALALGYDD